MTPKCSFIGCSNPSANRIGERDVCQGHAQWAGDLLEAEQKAYEDYLKRRYPDDPNTHS